MFNAINNISRQDVYCFIVMQALSASAPWKSKRYNLGIQWNPNFSNFQKNWFEKSGVREIEGGINLRVGRVLFDYK